AVYYGHREMDLAMMALFGGFGDAWIGAYNEVYPLENGWKERIAIGQLYPLMVHVNLFGGGYRRSVENILSRFS
ncbi:MAG: fructosamine kinase family protein, partial [Flavobacteriales bacterium]|nr:fructosamine kinase family protein [Flavobacteriales bacterium]